MRRLAKRRYCPQTTPPSPSRNMSDLSIDWPRLDTFAPRLTARRFIGLEGRYSEKTRIYGCRYGTSVTARLFIGCEVLKYTPTLPPNNDFGLLYCGFFSFPAKRNGIPILPSCQGLADGSRLSRLSSEHLISSLPHFHRSIPQVPLVIGCVPKPRSIPIGYFSVGPPVFVLSPSTFISFFF